MLMISLTVNSSSSIWPVVKELKTLKAITELEESKEQKSTRVCSPLRSVLELWIPISTEGLITFLSELQS